MLQRAIAPPVSDVDRLTFPRVDKQILPNGIPIYIIDRGTQELSRLDILFTAGRVNDAHPLTAEFAANMLREGAGDMSSADIAEKFDYYGVSLQTLATMHNTYITLYSANRYFADVLPLLHTLITTPVYPETEFATLRDRGRQALMVDLEKVNTLASRAFSTQLFGAGHPYASAAELQDYDTLTTDMLRAYHRAYYTADRCRIVLSGRISSSMIDLVKSLFVSLPRGGVVPCVLPPLCSAGEHYRFVAKQGALQSGIRVGRAVVGRNHPDHHPLRILNTLLGGYFGSRLMSNIREDKGYTYGIQSGVITLPDAAYLVIQTQAAVAYVRPLLAEVERELHRLCDESVSPHELQMVRSYMIGDMLRLFDTPISVAEVFVSLVAIGLDFDYYTARFEAIRSVTPEQLQVVATRYFSPETFYTTVAGAEQ